MRKLGEAGEGLGWPRNQSSSTIWPARPSISGPEMRSQWLVSTPQLPGQLELCQHQGAAGPLGI